ncbi:hypothetical protein [Marinobacter subterrani]|uniref:hypothetical protein n=1 Tax=Marinobacter subterrani TaxID=1658765 RepID=UPI0023572CC3|nr:hypothetical protein [Marinobacter subterrani]
MTMNVNATLIQQANAAYLDIDTGYRHATGDSDALKGSDLDQIIYRIKNSYAHQSLTWLELTTCSRPYKQLADRERKSWSTARISKALEEAEKLGLIEATDRIGSNYVLTRAGQEYIPSWEIGEMQASLL